MQIVILGGGVVAGYTVRELVEQGIEPGQVKIITAENSLPYERPPLSKSFLTEEKSFEEILINSAEFYAENKIDVRLKTRIVEIDLRNRHLVAESGERIPFNKLVIATGSRPKKFDFASATLEGIYYLRSVDDARRISEAAQTAQTAAVIGGGFIGMETAASLAMRGLRVSLIYREERLMQNFFTPQISHFFERLYEKNGVALWPNKNVRAFGGDDHVTYVKLTTHEEVPADMVVAGIGAQPNIELFRDIGLHIDEGIVVNKYLESNMSGIYAAGDVAQYYDMLFDKRPRMEHWQSAVEQARHVAIDIFSNKRRRHHFSQVPYIFSDIFDVSYEFWGDTHYADQIIHRGDIGKKDFAVLWLRENRLIGTFLMGATDEERGLLPTLIRERRQLPQFIFEDQTRSLTELARQFTY